jgi:Dolichyl-phosphate-mannose-protein mannosyltransferase
VIRRLVPVHLWIAVALAVIVTGAGLIWNTRVAAGSDAYGYVSQADLWIRGDLHIDQSFGASVPWPLARWTFTPLGYRPEPDGYRIVPQYSPGLPLLMAGFKAIAGQCAMFWVVPICGGVLVLATYAIGRRIGRPVVGMAAAWIVATSPAMLFMLMAPMSDVPAAAAWAVAVACVLGQTPLAAGAAGIAAALAILIRPNLAPLAGVIVIWIAWRDRETGHWRDWRRVATPWFVMPTAAGAIAIAIINTRLYGSPLASGYDLTDGFLLSYVVPNLRRYVWWLVSAETPFALAGLACLAMPTARIWRTRSSREALWLLGGVAAVVWISYLLFVPWDAWWYLRFLLPTWPMMALGTASLAAAVYRARPPVLSGAVVFILVAIGVIGVTQAAHRETFTVARGEAKYVEVAKTVESLTGPDAVIISAQHSGSIRYYAGRLTLRWDVGDPMWLDRTVDWLAAHGHHPYFVLEPQEVDELRAKYGPANASARLDWTPMVSFRGGAITMYDGVRRRRGGTTVSQLQARASHECLPQKPAPRLR